MNVSTNKTASFPLCTILFLIFMVLKLCNVIAWSWWYVTMPLWLPILIAIAIAVGGILLIFALKK